LTLLDIRDTEKRKALIQVLERLEPDGETNTLAALQAAFRFDHIDAIVLFTDGQPTLSPRPLDGSVSDRNAGYRAQILEEIDRQVAAGRKVRIHTIGLGDYFDPALGELFRTMGERTGGTFIGR
jgi:hypothetical protein